MRGTPVEWGLLIMGALGVAGFVKADFEPSDGLVIAAGVLAVALAVWVVKTYPKPEEVYSPLQGRRRLRSPYSPTWLVFPMALICGWVFSAYSDPSPRSRRAPCLIVSAVLQFDWSPINSALEMAKQAEEQARQAQEAAAR